MAERARVLEARAVSAGYGSRLVVEDVTVGVGPGECLAIIGPNGAGKSTLLRVLAGVLEPRSGEVLLQGRPMAAIPRREVARLVAGVPAELSPAFSFRAREIVAMGRHPYLPLLGDLTAQDERAVRDAMVATESEALAGRWFDELSSGERQRVVLAQALAQEPRVLLLDEPTAHLDLAHQTQLLDLLKRLQAERSLAIVLVSHDLNLAGEYADRILLLARGRVRASGPPEAVLDYRLIEEVYQTVVVVETNRVSGRPRVVPVSRFHLGGGAP